MKKPGPVNAHLAFALTPQAPKVEKLTRAEARRLLRAAGIRRAEMERAASRAIQKKFGAAIKASDAGTLFAPIPSVFDLAKQMDSRFTPPDRFAKTATVVDQNGTQTRRKSA